MSEYGSDQDLNKEQAQKKNNVPTDPAYIDMQEFSKRELYQNAYLEMIGSFLFAYLGQGAILTLSSQPIPATPFQIALSQSLILGLLIFCCIETSGGNFNPLVSFGLWTSNIISFPRMLLYVAAQMVGMTLASMAMVLTLGLQNKENLTANEIGGASFKGVENFNAGGCFIQEFVASFMFIFIIHAAAADSNQAKLFRPYISAVLIGITCFINIIGTASIVPAFGGAGFNPGRVLGPSIVTGDYEMKWIYVLAPAMAAVVHSSVYRMAPYSKR